MKNKSVAIILALFMACSLSACGKTTTESAASAAASTSAVAVSNESAVTESSTEDTGDAGEVVQEGEYGKEEVHEIMNADLSEAVGSYTVIQMDSKDCTEEALADLYFNYFVKNNMNQLYIIYADKDDLTGIFINTGCIFVNEQFAEDGNGGYSICNSPDEIQYVPYDEHTIEKLG